MTIEHFKAEGIDITKDLSSIVYVDGVNGDDSNSGDFTSPKKTIEAAVTTVINTHSGSGSIKIAAGTYSETITLENTTLTRLYIEGIEGPGSVTVDALTSTADNENLTHFDIRNIDFTGAVNIACDVNGAGSLLGSDMFLMEECTISGLLTLKVMGYNATFTTKRELRRLVVSGGLVVENVYTLNVYDSAISGATQTITYNSANPEPQNSGFVIATFYSTRMPQTPTLSSNVAGRVSVDYRYGCTIGSNGEDLATIDANSAMSLSRGAYHSGHNAATGTHTVNGSLIIDGGAGVNKFTDVWDVSGGTLNILTNNVQFGDGNSVLHVDASVGSDYYNGLPEWPFATIDAAVTALVSAGGAGRIVVKGGTYSETLTLSSTTLTDVEIVSEGGIAVFNAFSCIADNENLKRLSLENLRFEGAFALKGDTDASDFLTAGQDVVWPASCLNNVTVNAGANDIEFAAGRTIELRGCNFRGTGDFIIENFNFVHMTEGFRVPQAGVGFILRGVAANPWHNGTKGNTFAYVYAGANAPAGVTTLSNDFGSGTSLFTLYGGARDVSASLITVGDDCRWDVFPYVYTNRDLQVDSGGTARVSPMSHAPNSAGWNVSAGGTLALDAPVQTNPWVDKAFADTGSTLLLGEVVNSTIFCDTSGGGTTLNLPVVDDNHDGLESQFTVTGGANLIVAGSGGATVMGSPNATVVSGSAQRLKYHHADTDWKFTS